MSSCDILHYDRIKEMKKQQKAQKEAWKLKQLIKQQNKLLAPNIIDVFGILESAHKCVYPKNQIEGILQFLDTKSIIMLSSTCKSLKTDIKNSNVINHPSYIQGHFEIILNYKNKLKLLEEENNKNKLYLAQTEKINFGDKIHRQLIHVKRFNPENFEKTKRDFIREWKLKYNRKLVFNGLCGTEYGTLWEA
jgi:hypothetical protein